METNEVIKALVAAQAEFKSALKQSNNPFFKSKYADMASIWEACSGALKKHSLAVSQHPGRILDNPNRLELHTELFHSSGQCLTSTMEIPIVKMDPQGFAATITYGRRVGLAALLGIIVDDDDGNAATHKPIHAKPVLTITKEEAANLKKLSEELGWTQAEREHLLLEYGLDSIMDLEKDQLKQFEAHLRGDR